MVVIPHITERTFYIIIAIIVVIGLIIVLIQIRRVKNSNKKVKYLDEELKLKKIDLVKGDLKSVCLKDKKVQKLVASSKIKSTNYRRLLGEVDEYKRSREFAKIENKLSALNKHEKEFDNKKHKFEMKDKEFKTKIGKYDKECWIISK